jgi:hypothetical protein
MMVIFVKLKFCVPGNAFVRLHYWRGKMQKTATAGMRIRCADGFCQTIWFVKRADLFTTLNVGRST